MLTDTRIEEINEFMLSELAANGFEDTSSNRYAFLQGLRDSWLEDEESEELAEEKARYVSAVNRELFHLILKLTMERIESR